MNATIRHFDAYSLTERRREYGGKQTVSGKVGTSHQKRKPTFSAIRGSMHMVSEKKSAISVELSKKAVRISAKNAEVVVMGDGLLSLPRNTEIEAGQVLKIRRRKNVDLQLPKQSVVMWTMRDKTRLVVGLKPSVLDCKRNE